MAIRAQVEAYFIAVKTYICFQVSTIMLDNEVMALVLAAFESA